MSEREVMIMQVCRTGVQTVEREREDITSSTITHRYFVTIKNLTYVSEVEVPIEAARRYYRAMMR